MELSFKDYCNEVSALGMVGGALGGIASTAMGFNPIPGALIGGMGGEWLNKRLSGQKKIPDNAFTYWQDASGEMHRSLPSNSPYYAQHYGQQGDKDAVEPDPRSPETIEYFRNLNTNPQSPYFWAYSSKTNKWEPHHKGRKSRA